jgi:hypothetical protein
LIADYFSTWKRIADFLGWSERHTRRKLQHADWLDRDEAPYGMTVGGEAVSLQAYKESQIAAVSSAHSLGRGTPAREPERPGGLITPPGGGTSATDFTEAAASEPWDQLPR